MQFTLDGAELFYTTHGSGPPMLVMHGGLGWDHTYLRAGLDPLGEAAELIYYDHRGNGRSIRPSDWEGITHRTWVADADALREHLGHEKILLFGHSYGGFLAQEYALTYPDRVEGLILCCTAPAMDFAEVIVGNAQTRGTQEQTETVLGMLSAPVPDDEAMQRGMETVLPLYFHDPAIARSSALFAEVKYGAAAFNHAFGRCAPTYDLLGQLDQITAPTLVVAGRHDWIMPPAEGAERIHAELPDSQLVVFETSGHFPWAEEPEAFRQTLESWISQLRAVA